ncbi:CU044_2847 family protein [Dactylosporangium sp. NPDC000244]|uniref:CU044_2847 family protein n=1 Tax=Dactylosporangium sp. NPDC000244 TaxID=3154365 RepID=UPI0033241079
MPDVQVQLPSGETVWVTVPEEDGPSNVSAAEVLHRLDLADFRAVIQGVARTTRAALAGLRPHEVSVEFGIGLAVKTGKLTSVLVEGGANASIKVTVGWKSADLDEAALEAAPAQSQ